MNAEPEYDERLDDEDLVEWEAECYADASTWQDPISKEGEKLYSLYAAKSLSDDDSRYIAQTERVTADFAFATGIINTIIGAELAQRTEAIFEPGDSSAHDRFVADVLTQATRVVNLRCKAHRKATDAYFDALITGYGYNEAFIDLSRMPVRPVTEHIQPWRVFPDPDAQEDNLTDASYFIRTSEMKLEEAQARWPEKADELRQLVTRGGSSRQAMPVPIPTQGFSGSTPSRRKKVSIREFQYRCAKARVAYVDPETGERLDVLREEFNERKAELIARQQAALEAYVQEVANQAEAAEAAGMLGANPPEPPAPPEQTPMIDESQAYFYPGWQHYRCFIARGGSGKDGVLLEKKALTPNMFTIQAVTGLKWKKPSEDRVRFYGVARVVYDAVVWLNRALRDYLDIMSRSAKGGGVIDASAFGNDPGKIAEFRKNVAKPGYFHIVEDGAIADGKIQFFPTVTAPEGFRSIYEMCIQALGRLTGVSEWLQGTGNSDRSNAYVTTMQEQGLQMLLPIREPRTAFTQSMGQLVASLIVHHLPAEEIDRIVGEQKPVLGVTHEKVPNPQTGQEEVQQITTAGQILKEVDLLHYDVSEDVGAATPSQRAATWLWASQHGLAQTFIDWGVPPDKMVPMLVRNSPLPGTQAETLATDLEEFFSQRQQLQTEQGVVDFFSGLPFEQQAAILQQLQQNIAPPEDAGMVA